MYSETIRPLGVGTYGRWESLNGDNLAGCGNRRGGRRPPRVVAPRGLVAFRGVPLPPQIGGQRSQEKENSPMVHFWGLSRHSKSLLNLAKLRLYQGFDGFRCHQDSIVSGSHSVIYFSHRQSPKGPQSCGVKLLFEVFVFRGLFSLVCLSGS